MRTRIFSAIFVAVSIFLAFNTLVAQSSNYYGYSSYGNNATIIFRNSSDYNMVVKIIHLYGGLYTTVSLNSHSSRTVTFNKSSTFKMKIKATPQFGQPSYHDGGTFSVTCTESEWTEGEIKFQLSSYGRGLGPTISSKEFERNN